LTEDLPVVEEEESENLADLPGDDQPGDDLLGDGDEES
jgi:hypothetical protein